jgi:hypothetical protein
LFRSSTTACGQLLGASAAVGISSSSSCGDQPPKYSERPLRSGPDEAVNVVTVRPDGSDWTYLTHYPAGFRANVGGYSPDGQWIVFRLEGPGLVPTMYRIRPDGTDLHALYASSTIVPRFIDWGPAVRH